MLPGNCPRIVGTDPFLRNNLPAGPALYCPRSVKQSTETWFEHSIRSAESCHDKSSLVSSEAGV